MHANCRCSIVVADSDERFMREALALAGKGLFSTDPNPRVGAVVVRNNEIVGRGWHRRPGEPHAEVIALEQAGERADGASMYVTLEPCNHHGRTGPCAAALAASGIRRVVIAVGDPSPLAAGGADRLRAAGLEVLKGLGEEDARALNPGFFKRHEHGLPFVRVKLAASLDGRTALANGRSQWITGEEAREDVHRWRARSSVVLTGSGTVIDDDPELSVRAVQTGRQPIRAVLDRRGRTRPDARLYAEGPVLRYVEHPDPRWPAHVEQIRLRRGDDLGVVLADLAGREVNELFVEAGASLAGAFFDSGLVDEWLIYLAPCLIGDDGAPMIKTGGIECMEDLFRWPAPEVDRFGADIRLRLHRA